jgi:hypothetical protein
MTEHQETQHANRLLAINVSNQRGTIHSGATIAAARLPDGKDPYFPEYTLMLTAVDVLHCSMGRHRKVCPHPDSSGDEPQAPQAASEVHSLRSWNAETFRYDMNQSSEVRHFCPGVWSVFG